MLGPFDVQKLYAALDKQRHDRGLSWAVVAREIGVSASTIRRTRIADDLEADGMLQMVRWLGLAPESFARDRKPADPVALTGALRAAPGILRADTRAMHAALEGQRVALQITWTKIATEFDVEISKARLIGLRKGGRTSAQTLLSAARWLGRRTETLVRVDTTQLLDEAP
ncbi:MAG: hypothetical protein M3349_03525 [Actinomycetota bacterium]|nr:hypothetical protein [Actinomycetota bacterium]